MPSSLARLESEPQRCRGPTEGPGHLWHERVPQQAKGVPQSVVARELGLSLPKATANKGLTLDPTTIARFLKTAQTSPGKSGGAALLSWSPSRGPPWILHEPHRRRTRTSEQKFLTAVKRNLILMYWTVFSLTGMHDKNLSDEIYSKRASDGASLLV